MPHPPINDLQKRCNLTGEVKLVDISLLARQLRDVQRDVAFRLAPVLADLQSDIVIPAGISVFLDGGGATVKTLGFQFRVEDGARLCMYNMSLVEGTESAIQVGRSVANISPVYGIVFEPVASSMLDMAWVTISNMKTSTGGAALNIHGNATVTIFKVCAFPVRLSF